MNINECTIVAGKKNNNLFLFKNGDTPTLWDHEIVRDIKNGVEVVYYTNQKGWVEGMNELGIGMVYALLSVDPYYDTKFKLKNSTKMPYKDTIDPYYISKKGDFLLDVISSHTIEEALDKIKNSGWYGNYFISNGTETYEIENFYFETKVEKVEFSGSTDFKVKTNYGILEPTAGQIDDPHNLRRADSELRKTNAERYLSGFKNYDDVIQRMGFQEFDKRASYNLFRTDDTEKTTSQALLDLRNLDYYFIYHDTNEKFRGILDKTKDIEDYKHKIKIILYNKKHFQSSEYLEFIKKKNSLYHIGGKD